jgi:hypothetical protein
MSVRNKTARRPPSPIQAPEKLSPRKRAVSHKTLHPKQAPVLAYTFKDASRLSGIRLTTLRKWLVTGKITRGKDGAFDIKQLLKLGAQEDHSLTAGVRRSPQAQKSYDQYWTAKAEEKALDVAIKKGELIDRERVTQELIDRETVFKNRLLGLSDFLASRLVGCGAQEIKAVCTETFMGLLKELARKGSEAYKNTHPD